MQLDDLVEASSGSPFCVRHNARRLGIAVDAQHVAFIVERDDDAADIKFAPLACLLGSLRYQSTQTDILLSAAPFRSFQTDKRDADSILVPRERSKDQLQSLT